MKIAILDYGIGNLHSALKAFRLYCPETEITSNPREIRNSNGLVLPGVGAFAAGMAGLKSRGLDRAVMEAANQNKPIIGICLGAQLFLSRGREFGDHEGLGLIKGEVVRFPEIKQRIPHIGWNEIRPPAGVSWKNTIFDGTGNSPEMYFVHSYIMQPEDTKDILSETEYGDFVFASSIMRRNLFGCQFHPEKSGKTGLKIIENFVHLVDSRRNSM